MTLLQVSDWEKYTTVRTWRRNLISKSHSKELSENAWNQRRTYFMRFMKFTGMNPDELIEYAKIDNESARDLVDDFYRDLIKTIQKSSAISACYGMIRGFYSNNGIVTQFWNSPKMGVLQSHITDEQNPIFIKTNEGYQLDRVFLKKFLNILEYRDKIICLGMLTSSLDISDILKLKIGDVKYQKKSRLYIVGQRPKTGEVYKTFFTKETSKFVRDYIENYRENAEDEEIIFIPENRMISRVYKKITGKNLFENGIKVGNYPILTPMSHENIDMIFRRTSKKIGIQCKKGQSQPFRPKRFRHTFVQCCTRSGIPNTVIDKFTGHKGHINKQYETESRFELEDYYEQVEPMLTIYEDISKETKIVELEKKISKLEERKEGISDFGDEMLVRIKRLEQENRELRENYRIM